MIFAERIGSGTGRGAKNRSEARVQKRTRQFDQSCAFAGTSQATKPGEYVRTRYDMRQSLALVRAEMTGCFIAIGNGVNSLNTSIDRPNQEKLFFENLPCREIR